jgi:hypothetical protein
MSGLHQECIIEGKKSTKLQHYPVENVWQKVLLEFALRANYLLANMHLTSL